MAVIERRRQFPAATLVQIYANKKQINTPLPVIEVAKSTGRPVYRPCFFGGDLVASTTED